MPSERTARPLTIVSISAEAAPWSKVGGLADVAAALPVALAERGHRVIAVAPRYREYAEAWDSSRTASFGLFGQEHQVAYFHARIQGVERVFVGHPALTRGGVYGDHLGPYGDNQLRFALLCRAGLEAAHALGLELPADGADTIFLAHDWHAGLVPLYLAARYRQHGLWQRARSVLALHNMAHQGVFGADSFAGLDLEQTWWPLLDMYGELNTLKGGIVGADRLVTVSARYAQEIQSPEQGFGLDGLLRMRSPVLEGIRNGLDTRAWDPATDPHLPATFSAADRSGRARCKAELQAELGLQVDPDVPLVGCVGRLDHQKGVDLLLQAWPWLREQGAQLVVLGSGDPHIEGALRAAEGPAMKAWIGFSGPLAHRITAGADIFVVPSRFEPCGLTQLQAMRYGSVPVVAATGGLHDTVQPYDPFAQTGTGWRFHPGSADSLVNGLGDALYTLRHWPDAFRGLQLRGMQQDWSWRQPARAYEDLFERTLDAPPLL